MTKEILSHLPMDFPWNDHIQHFRQLESTNTYAKKLAAQSAPQGTVVIAESQTHGRGRMGRSFYSPEDGGIYLSVILRPTCPPEKLMHLTCGVGVAVCNAIQEVAGLRPGIKWINDLVIQNKKLGGILTELSIKSDGNVDYAIVGIGINCNLRAENFPPELRNIATSIYDAIGSKVSRPRLIAAMLMQLQKMADKLLEYRDSIMEQYRSDCVTLGKEVVIHAPQGIRNGYACRICNDGALQIRFSDGHTETVYSGDVSVRGMYGYA